VFGEIMTWYPLNASESPMPSSCRQMAHLSRVRSARLLVSPQEAQEDFVHQSHRIACRCPPLNGTATEHRRI